VVVPPPNARGIIGYPHNIRYFHFDQPYVMHPWYFTPGLLHGVTQTPIVPGHLNDYHRFGQNPLMYSQSYIPTQVFMAQERMQGGPFPYPLYMLNQSEVKFNLRRFKNKNSQPN